MGKLVRVRDMLKLIQKALSEELKLDVTYTSETVKKSTNLQRIKWYGRYKDAKYVIAVVIIDWRALRLQDDASLYAHHIVSYIDFQDRNYYNLTPQQIKWLTEVEEGIYCDIEASDEGDITALNSLFTDKLIDRHRENGQTVGWPYTLRLTKEGTDALLHVRKSKFVEI
jgi:hypothetical protein